MESPRRPNLPGDGIETVPLLYWVFCWQHCLKSFQIRSYFWSEYRKIRTRNNSVFGHFTQCGDSRTEIILSRYLLGCNLLNDNSLGLALHSKLLVRIWQWRSFRPHCHICSWFYSVFSFWNFLEVKKFTNIAIIWFDLTTAQFYSSSGAWLTWEMNGKFVCFMFWSFILIKLQAFILATQLKRGSNVGVLWWWQKFRMNSSIKFFSLVMVIIIVATYLITE